MGTRRSLAGIPAQTQKSSRDRGYTTYTGMISLQTSTSSTCIQGEVKDELKLELRNLLKHQIQI